VKKPRRSVMDSFASIIGPFVSPMKSLLAGRLIPGHFEQRNVNGYVVRTWVPAKPGEPKSKHPEPSRGAGTEVNFAAASYIAALRLENDIPLSNTSIACL